MRLQTGIAAAAVLALGGCNSNPAAPTAESTSAAPAVTEETSAPVATEDQGPPPPPDPTVAAAAPAPKAIPVRGKGSIEEKCLKAVAREANNQGVGVNRIEESEAAIEVYVNLDGATAPWKCVAYRDGTIGEVSFTGSEGDL